MKPIFGPRTPQVLTFLTDLWRLSPEQISEVSKAWKKANDLKRAEAWAQIQRATSKSERHRILSAAAVARRQAMDVAHVYHRTDWAFWAAAWDAAAAIAADDGTSRQYEILTAPLMPVLSSLAGDTESAQVPAQRSGRVPAQRTRSRGAKGREDAGRDRATADSARQHAARGDRSRGAGRE